MNPTTSYPTPCHKQAGDNTRFERRHDMNDQNILFKDTDKVLDVSA